MELVSCELTELEFEHRRLREKDSPAAIAYSDKYTLMYGDFSFF